MMLIEMMSVVIAIRWCVRIFADVYVEFCEVCVWGNAGIEKCEAWIRTVTIGNAVPRPMVNREYV